MQAYQIEHNVPATHRVAFELPPNSPVGSAKIIVLFPDSTTPSEETQPRFSNMAEYLAWHDTQPASGRSPEEIDRQIREEREGWSD